MINTDLTIHLAADHAGLADKESLKAHLETAGYQVTDHGAVELMPQDDYPDNIIPAVQAAVADQGLAIVFGSSGQGEAIAANKVIGARAVVYYGGITEILKLSREHNNANVLSLGARFLTETQVKEAVDIWLHTTFSGDERHGRRLGKISSFEQNQKTE